MIESRTGRPMTANEAEIARLIWLNSREHPVSVRALAEINALTEREVKGIVQSLRTKHLLPIGASRLRGKSGYWWARTPEELEASARPLVNQAKRMLVSAARLTGKRRVLEMLGQEVFGEAEAAN